MNSIKTIISSQYQWYKRDLFWIMAANIVAGVLFYTFNFYRPVEVLAELLLLIMTISCVGKVSLFPTVGQSMSRFSWKYMQSLAINRRELLFGMALSRLIAFIPLFVWSIAFNYDVYEYFGLDEVPLHDVIRINLTLAIIIFLSGIISAHRLVSYPRKQFQVHSSIGNFLYLSRVLLITTLILFYIFLCDRWLRQYTGFNLSIVLEFSRDAFNFIIESWALPALAAALTAALYYTTLLTWRIEARSYSARNIHPKRELILISIAVALFAIPILGHDIRTPYKYTGNEAMRAAYFGDMAEIKRLIKDESVMTYTNKYGFTPFLVALHRGNLPIVKLIDEHYTIKLGSRVTVPGKNRLKEITPLLIAADSFKLPVVKYLLENGVHTNTHTSGLGESALHIAASNCTPAIAAALIDHGAKVNLKDNEGKTPLVRAFENSCAMTAVILKDSGAKLTPSEYEEISKLELWSRLRFYLERYFGDSPL